MAGYWFAASFGDLIFEIGLMFILGVLAGVFVIYIVMSGTWGRQMWHSVNRHLALIVQHGASIQLAPTKNFGSLLQISSGDQKGELIIPRYAATYKSKDSPQISIVLGRGVGHQADPYLAEYVKRLGAGRPKGDYWTGVKPTKTPKDAEQLYVAYAEWKAQTEASPDAKTKEDYINQHINDVTAPVLPPDKLEGWIRERKDRLGQVFESTQGTFSNMLAKLKDPGVNDRDKNAIREVLNGEMMSEPPEVWATNIAGFQVNLSDLARFMEPISSAELTNSVNMIYEMLRKEQGNAIKILLILSGVAVLIIGMAIAGYIVVHG